MALTASHAFTRSPTWLGRAEAWLDARGKGAWIALTILGLALFWPIGLAILAYAIWSRRMFTRTSRATGARFRTNATGFRTSGNMAFDAYKAETLRRLEDEQDAFEAFLGRLREAKDKAEFDQFMADRERNGKSGGETVDA